MITPAILECLAHLAEVEHGTIGAQIGECDWIAEILMILECRHGGA